MRFQQPDRSIDALNQLAQSLSLGDEYAERDLLDAVTPVTAGLLRWWFGAGEPGCPGAGLHAGEQRLLLNFVVAHEVAASVDAWSAKRHRGGMDDGEPMPRPAAVAVSRYRMALLDGLGRDRLLLALIAWQWLNAVSPRTPDAAAPCFTPRFLLLGSGSDGLGRLLDMFLGPAYASGGKRRFAGSAIARLTSVLLPPAHREPFLRFVRGHASPLMRTGERSTRDGWIVLAERSQWVELMTCGESGPRFDGRRCHSSADTCARHALALLTRASDLMLLDDRHGSGPEGDMAPSPTERPTVHPRQRRIQVELRPSSHVSAAPGEADDARSWLVADFGLAAAIAAGVVKQPVLDASVAPPERDEAGGDGVLCRNRMRLLRAGLARLRALEAAFARLDVEHRPRMLVLCEDRRILPLLAPFLEGEGLDPAEVVVAGLENGPVGQSARFAGSRVRVLVDRPRPDQEVRADASICVVVPLRLSRSAVPVESLVARALAPMWSDWPAARQLRRESDACVRRTGLPACLIDALWIVECPRFHGRYRSLLERRLLARGVDTDDESSIIGDLVRIGLRDDFRRYDFSVPTLGSKAVAGAGMGGSTSRRMSAVSSLLVRGRQCLPVSKCIHPQLPHDGGAVQAFLQWADADPAVEAFSRIDGEQHGFLRWRAVARDGHWRAYGPDFLVRTKAAVYLVELSAWRHSALDALGSAMRWCEQINALPPARREGRMWWYVRLCDARIEEAQCRGSALEGLLRSSRVGRCDHVDADPRPAPAHAPSRLLPES